MRSGAELSDYVNNCDYSPPAASFQHNLHQEIGNQSESIRRFVLLRQITPSGSIGDDKRILVSQ